MQHENAPLGDVSEKLLALTVGSANPVRGLTGRELRRAAARAAKKAAKRR